MTNGIYLLTTRQGEQVNGMVVSWASQVSYEPPLIMVAVHPNRFSHTLIEQSGRFALHAIARDQADLIGKFKGPDPEGKFASLDWVEGVSGCPVLKGCIACLECEVRETYRPGNHTLFIGEIVEAHAFFQGTPLCTGDYGGTYTGKH